MKWTFFEGEKIDLSPPSWWKFGKFLWLILGNADEPHQSFWWYVRNPFHNLTFYLIGFKHKDRLVIGKEPDKVFINEGLNWYYGIILAFPFIPLPFISFQKKIGNKVFQFYLGWRLGACFGFKLRLTEAS